ncbi:hypothetical protein PHLH8_27300 [Pseudomonas sp. Pc102]|uniref:hypothetical protein n=1 Tax=Pseudomonas sp. Pc102 TaxID=2678261 RepID=UPI001BD016AC|nr:hypothetical protein [Pseudomonas sp. Pc102]BBP83088.1 hypothetical protein PHLH8_27300 [Pseudomonas sp. Pc102]
MFIFLGGPGISASPRLLFSLTGMIFFLAFSGALFSAEVDLDKDVVAAEQPLGTASYSDIRKAVLVKDGAKVESLLSTKRPAGFYQLAGVRDEVLCAEFLEDMNKEGGSAGNLVEWLSSSSRRLAFQPLEESRAMSEWTGVERALEFVSMDVDGDGSIEQVYRRTGIIREHGTQQLMITDEALHERPGKLLPYGPDCLKWQGKRGRCGAAAGLIQHVMNLPANSRLAEEWVSTRQDPIGQATGDAQSGQSIYGRQRNRLVRNVGLGSSAYWAVYRLHKGPVFVSVPTRTFAPPELLVFSMRRNGPSELQCIVMPVVWGK